MEKHDSRYLVELKNFVVSFLKDEKVTIFLFGSRARGDYHSVSDVDIGLMPHGKIKEGKISLLRDEIDELNIPYKVEIVNFSEVSEEFRKEAMNDMVIWKD